MDRKDIAAKGEELATRTLTKKGYRIIERNYRYGRGEIDIIAMDPHSNCTVFVEVKARGNLEFGEPEYAITKAKQKQIRKIAGLYLFEKHMKELDCRFDVVTVLYGKTDDPVINHYKNAF